MAGSTVLPEGVLLWEIEKLLNNFDQQLDLNVSFIRNGGDSLSALRISTSCRSKGVLVTVAALMSCTSLIDLINDLRHRYAKNDFSYHGDERNRSTNPAILCSEQVNICNKPLATRTQLSLIHESESLSGGGIIRYYETYRLEHIQQVKSAWHTLTLQEPIFRITFQVVENQYCLAESADAVFTWEEVTTDNRAAYLSMQREYNSGDEVIGSTFKVFHFKSETEDSESTVVWSIHHALMDGYSSALLLNKHRSHLAGRLTTPAPSLVQFIDRISTVKSLSAKPNACSNFWIAQEVLLKSAHGELQLPLPGLPYNPVYASTDVDLRTTSNHMYQCSKLHGVTVASLLYAAWALTLSRYVGSDHVYFGIVMSGRSVPITGADTVIGPLINTVPFQVSVDRTQKVSDFLVSVFQYAIILDEHQWSMPQGISQNRCSSIMNIHFTEPDLADNPLGLLHKPKSDIISNVPLRVEVHSSGNIQILFHEHIFSRKHIERLARTFSGAIDTLVNSSETIGNGSDSLLEHEAKRLRVWSNCTGADTTGKSCDETLVSLFDQRVREIPSNTALLSDAQVVTYLELYTMASTIGHSLRQHVKPGDVVCVHADRTIKWMAAILGVLKAGGIYCPLDPSLPSNIREQNFLQSGSQLFIVGQEIDKSYQPASCQLCLSIDEILQVPSTASRTTTMGIDEHYINAILDPDAGAYLCYTSGSTGKPKGVLCTHRSLVAFQKTFDVRLRSRPGWRISQVMSPAFDGSIHEIFSALCYGSTLVLRKSTDPFGQLSNADAAILTPSIANLIQPHDYPSLKVVYLVGEAVPQAVCDKWAGRITTFNMYGPTEGTCGATIKELKPNELVTLGRPNPSSRVYVLDHRRRFAPIGVIGEVYLAGIQVSKGYLKQPEETAAMFTADCMLPQTNDRMYRTGDRGFWNEAGELCFCGRSDRQIKLRGFRVDLDDIEIRIRKSLQECTGVMVAYHDGDLVALVQPANLDLQLIKNKLLEVLPSYAMPQWITSVPVLPQTNAGKLDYKALTASLTKNTVPEGVDTESHLFKRISRVWKELLPIHHVPLHKQSNFLELGGHSLLQLQLANNLSNLFRRRIPLVVIMESPTLGDLVERLAQVADFQSLDTSGPDIAESYVSPIEMTWWRKYHFNQGCSSFNVAVCFELGPRVESERLSHAWNLVLARHPILRSRFRETCTGSVQKLLSETPAKVKAMDSIDIQREINLEFNLEHDDPIRISLAPSMLVVVVSHIICDYTTLKILLQEASSAYMGLALDKPVNFEHLVLRQPSCDDINFWKSYLHSLPVPNYSVGRMTSPRTSYNGSSHLCRIRTSKFRKLDHFMSSQRVTGHQMALAAVALALQHHTDSFDLVLGAPYLGRNTAAEYESVGLFLQLLPMRIRHSPSGIQNDAHDHSCFLSDVKKCSQEAIIHAIPWHDIIKALDASDDLPDSPLFDVMVSFHDNFNSIGMPDIDARPLYTWSEGSKFKAMVEFVVANDNCLLVRLEYSHECFGADEVAVLGRLITLAFEELVDNTPLAVIKDHLSQVRLRGNQRYYGVRLEDL